MNIVFLKILRRDYVRGMLVTVRFVCLSVYVLQVYLYNVGLILGFREYITAVLYRCETWCVTLRIDSACIRTKCYIWTRDGGSNWKV
jgi:hypothetical protein